jgi:hypothetical protein
LKADAIPKHLLWDLPSPATVQTRGFLVLPHRSPEWASRLQVCSVPGGAQDVAVIETQSKCVRGFSRRRRFRSRPQFRVLTSLHVGLGTDAPTAFRVPESRDGPTADRSDASIGFQSGNVCVSASEQPGSSAGLQSISLHVGPLYPATSLGTGMSEHKDPHRTDGIKRTPPRSRTTSAPAGDIRGGGARRFNPNGRALRDYTPSLV